MFQVNTLVFYRLMYRKWLRWQKMTLTFARVKRIVFLFDRSKSHFWLSIISKMASSTHLMVDQRLISIKRDFRIFYESDLWNYFCLFIFKKCDIYRERDLESLRCSSLILASKSYKIYFPSLSKVNRWAMTSHTCWLSSLFSMFTIRCSLVAAKIG